MLQRSWWGFLGTWLIAGSAVAQAPVPVPGPAAPAAAPAPAPAAEDLGGGRYRIGRIEVDKGAARFTVPGRVLRLDPPLEYLAVTPGGYKAYESLLELDAGGVEFNLACILIGLDAEGAQRPEYQFDPRPAKGQRVAVSVGWDAAGSAQRVSAAEALAGATPGAGRPTDGPGLPAERPIQKPTDDWVYIGSFFLQDGAYAAAQIGTLVGFVHDPAAVIEHRPGLGIGSYGSVGGNKALPWAVGTPVVLTVERVVAQ